MKESSPSTNFPVTAPSVVMNEENQGRASISISDARRKVSFEDDSFSLLGYDYTTLLDSEYAFSMVNEDKRVVSNGIIHGISDLKMKSKSLPSLTRSGDLKSMLEGAGILKVPAVSEDCLSSSIHDEEMMHESQNDSRTLPTESLPAHASCTGWGQFVDFVPFEQTDYPRGKQICPKRRRSSSFSACSRYRRYLQHGVHKYQKEQQKQGSISSMYNRNKDLISTNEVTDSFRIQLSLTTK